jgi:hypothetical protein
VSSVPVKAQLRTHNNHLLRILRSTLPCNRPTLSPWDNKKSWFRTQPLRQASPSHAGSSCRAYNSRFVFSSRASPFSHSHEQRLDPSDGTTKETLRAQAAPEMILARTKTPFCGVILPSLHLALAYHSAAKFTPHTHPALVVPHLIRNIVMPTPHTSAPDTALSANGPPDGVPFIGGPGTRLRLVTILYGPGPRPREPATPLSQSNIAAYLPPRPIPVAAGVARQAPTTRQARDQTHPYFKRVIRLRLPHERVRQGSSHRNRTPDPAHPESASHVRFHESEGARRHSPSESDSSLSSDEESGSSNSSHSSSRPRASTGKRRDVGRPASAPVPSSTPPATPARVAGSAATQPTAGPSSVLHPTGPPPGLPTSHGAAMAKPRKPELGTKQHLRWSDEEWKRVKVMFPSPFRKRYAHISQDVADNVLTTLTDIALSASNQPKGKLEECYAEVCVLRLACPFSQPMTSHTDDTS